MRYGLGTALAVLLVYKLAFDWQTQLQAVSTQLTNHIAEYRADQRALQHYLFRTCVNTAKTDRDATLCQPESQR